MLRTWNRKLQSLPYVGAAFEERDVKDMLSFSLTSQTHYSHQNLKSIHIYYPTHLFWEEEYNLANEIVFYWQYYSVAP